MYAAEVLSQLRSLNHLCREVHSLPQTSPEVVLLEKQIAELRARLPNSILAYHDRLAARGRPSAKVKAAAPATCDSRAAWWANWRWLDVSEFVPIAACFSGKARCPPNLRR